MIIPVITLREASTYSFSVRGKVSTYDSVIVTEVKFERDQVVFYQQHLSAEAAPMGEDFAKGGKQKITLSRSNIRVLVKHLLAVEKELQEAEND